jgi:hypothetical protein
VYQQKDYAPDFLIKAALNFIDKNVDKPFFLFYTTPLPHVSLQAPKKWVDYYHKNLAMKNHIWAAVIFHAVIRVQLMQQ